MYVWVRDRHSNARSGHRGKSNEADNHVQPGAVDHVCRGEVQVEDRPDLVARFASFKHGVDVFGDRFHVGASEV